MIAFLRQLIFKDIWLKLFSLALAILIWLTVTFAIQKVGSPAASLSALTRDRTFYNLPVLVLSAAADVRDFKVKPPEAEVTVQGDPKTVENLQSKDIKVMVDLTGIEAGAGNFRARVQVSTPIGVTHVRVVPEDVEVIFPAKG